MNITINIIKPKIGYSSVLNPSGPESKTIKAKFNIESVLIRSNNRSNNLKESIVEEIKDDNHDDSFININPSDYLCFFT